MPKIFKFTRLSLRDLFVLGLPPLVVIVALCVVAYWLINPTPPRRIVLSTGQPNSSYAAYGKHYAEMLAKQGIQVVLKPSAGSKENLERLTDPNSGVDIAFVQSGSTDQVASEQHGLISLGSLFPEPVWLFYREPHHIRDLSQLKGLRVNVGPDGSGVPALFRKLLDANRVAPESVRMSGLDNTPATVALLDGRIDALVFVSAPNTPLIQMLLQTPGIRLFNFDQAEAYTRRFPFLSHVVLPRGIVDLGKNIPSRDGDLIAPTATLVARSSLHPALIDLFVQSASRLHGKPGWFRKRGEFPNADYTEIPVAGDAEKFYRSGPPFLQRYMPFWLANFFERMWVAIVALGALFLPLSRVLPPLYVWRVRSRVYRWYGELRAVEQAVEDVPTARRAEVYRRQLGRLNEIEDKVNQITIPLSFAEELYGLRSHIHYVRKRLGGLIREDERATA